MQDAIHREVTIDAPVERVWSLITEAEHLGRWFGDAGAEIDLRPGGALTLRWDEHGAHDCLIEAVEPHKRFAFRWKPGGVPAAEGNTTLVEFVLRPDGDGTCLAVTESGFASMPASEQERLESLRGNTRGWEAELGDLVEHAQRVAA